MSTGKTSIQHYVGESCSKSLPKIQHCMRVMKKKKKRHGRIGKCKENRQDLNAYINQSDVSITPRKKIKYHSMVCTSYVVTTSKYSKNVVFFLNVV